MLFAKDELIEGLDYRNDQYFENSNLGCLGLYINKYVFTYQIGQALAFFRSQSPASVKSIIYEDEKRDVACLNPNNHIYSINFKPLILGP